MRIKVDMQLKGEQIAYILCRYFNKHKTWPKPRNGLYHAIKVYLSEYGEPMTAKVEAAQNGAPILYGQAIKMVERYFPYSFD